LHSFLEQVVADYMTREPKVVRSEFTLRELGDLFGRDDFNAYPVEDHSQVIGVVSKFDFLASFIFTPAHMIPHYDDLMKLTVMDVMTPEFIYVGMETKLTRGASTHGQSPDQKHADNHQQSAPRRHDFAQGRPARLATRCRR
jgi:predicted transcriptional regulator